ncbi:Transposase [Caenorhabditis elegans]|uniref:Transposase n=1 Tax=Caenorhabditis elegans TaxID=6239 RepID=Q9XX54_CAEEL|nr:Transposase [Caenorhabditis elegans]CAA20984.1 Transposase [Caenorhabditis elegans]|eukprot:NP_507947.1 Uncharacterized protein CELE_Y38H6C.4 [Caenorhabditis elegans]
MKEPVKPTVKLAEIPPREPRFTPEQERIYARLSVHDPFNMLSEQHKANLIQLMTHGLGYRPIQLS